MSKNALTTALVKETLRLYSPAGSTRGSFPGATVTDLKGNQHPMDYLATSLLHLAVHLNERVWPRAKEFLPERFLVGPDHELYPDPAAFRPFEQGPRNCIGQTLVWNELKIILILTCRDLVIRDAYDDFDAEREKNKSSLQRINERVFGKLITTFHGDRAYQTDTGGNHPVDGYPCYVSWAEHAAVKE